MIDISNDNPVWSPASWRGLTAVQQPVYESAEQVAACIRVLSEKPPLVAQGEVEKLRAELAEAAEGRRFLLHGGDCAERFSDCRADVLTRKLQVLLQMSMVLTYATRKSVIRIGRIAGQYAKPRSNATEEVDGKSLPVYRGDLINDYAATEGARCPDPARMLAGYHHATASLNYIRALIEGGFADLHHPERWDLEFINQSRHREEYRRTADAISDAVRFMDTIGAAEAMETLRRVAFYTSHEALLLPYEEALTRTDAHGAAYNLGAHYLWLGYRTCIADGAHVEYLRGIENPIAVKVGPQLDAGTLINLLRILDPRKTPGRITLISRLGAGKVASSLTPLIQAVSRTKHPVLWCCDPMHGNTETTADGRKTRRMTAIFTELEQTFAVHAEQGSCLGGVHFELTGEPVTECVGGSGGVAQARLSERYDTACDPRMNGGQALELAFLIARLLRCAK